MSFTSRVAVSNGSTLGSFDAPASVASTYSGTAAVACNNEMVAGLVAIKGASSFIQGAGTASLGTVSSFAKSFPGNNTAGNCIVVDVCFNPTTIFPTGLACTDSNGNTYTQVFSHKLFGGLVQSACFVAFGISSGANTVTITCTSNAAIDPSIAVHEYQGGTAVDTYQTQDIVGTGTVTLSVTTTQSGDLLHMFGGIVSGCPGSPTSGGPSGGNVIPGAWLVINEPGLGYTDRTTYMWKGPGNQNNWTQQARQRGQATIHLRVAGTDAYAPTKGSPLFLFEQTAAGYGGVFSGLIQDINNQYFGNQGDRYIVITAVSFESIFDTVYAEPTQFVNQTCGAIVTALFNAFETGALVALGTISNGATIPLFNAPKGAKLNDLFDQLATTSGFTWFVDPSTLLLYFGDPASVPAPFSLAYSDILWDTVDWKLKNADYRNRQGVRLSFDAFEHSKEFFTGSGQTSVTLSRPVKQVTNAWATLSTCNTATGTFSGQPAANDTVTIGPAAGARQASHAYALGGIIIVNGYVQRISTAGTTAAGSGPTFSTVTGGTTIDGTAIWTCDGPSGLATGTETYIFVNTIDNSQFGQVLIGASAAATCQNLVDAINRYIGGASGRGPGTNYSLPTWEGSQCNAIYTSGTTFTLQQKSAGTSYVSQISKSSANFAWSAGVTSGGTSPQGSLGPNQGATISLQVYEQGTSVAAPGLSYVEGSAVLTLATPLNSGSNLNVEYTRADGDSIEVEDTTLVTALAAITHGTGKYQAWTDQSTTGLISSSRLAGLQLAQQLLSLFKVPPQYFRFSTYRTGLRAGMTLPAAITIPSGASSFLNGNWFIESVDATLVPVPSTGSAPYLPGFGHYKYSISMVNVTQIGSAVDFWKLRGGGGGGGGGGASNVVPTSGGAIAPAGLTVLQKYTTSWSAQTSVTVTHNLGTTDVTVQVFDSNNVQVDPESLTATSVNVVTLTFGAAFTGRVVVIG